MQAIGSVETKANNESDDYGMYLGNVDGTIKLKIDRKLHKTEKKKRYDNGTCCENDIFGEENLNSKKRKVDVDIFYKNLPFLLIFI